MHKEGNCIHRVQRKLDVVEHISNTSAPKEETGIPEASRTANPAYTEVEKSLPQTRWAGRLSSDFHTLKYGMYTSYMNMHPHNEHTRIIHIHNILT